MTCILCESPDARIVDRVPFRALAARWRRTFRIEVERCLEAPWPETHVPLYACAACALEFYPPALAGTEALYAELGRRPSYYMAQKWEFGVALTRLRPAGATLEVGAGDGAFVAAARARFPDARVEGVELSRAAVERARRERDVELIARPLEALGDAPGFTRAFDVVCSFQVLEHVPRPGDFLRDMRRCLRPGGLLLLSVPNRDGFMGDSANDVMNMPPHHISRWGREVFARFAAREGLTLELVADEPVATYHQRAYRHAALTRRLARLARVTPPRVSTRADLRYGLVDLAARVVDRVLPARLWRYDRRGGHTLLVGLRAAGA